MRVVYRQDDIIHKFVRKIMTLPFLPAQHIQSMFVRIESLVPPNGEMCELINYVWQPWIEHSFCSPLLDSVQHRSLVQPYVGGVPFSLPLVPVCTVYLLFLASVHREIPLGITGTAIYSAVLTFLLILLLKHIITQILCKGLIN